MEFDEISRVALRDGKTIFFCERVFFGMEGRGTNTNAENIPNIPNIPHLLVILRDILRNDSASFTDGFTDIGINRGLFFPGLRLFFP